jgi:hypothetical protein
MRIDIHSQLNLEDLVRVAREYQEVEISQDSIMRSTFLTNKFNVFSRNQILYMELILDTEYLPIRQFLRIKSNGLIAT